MQISSVPYKFQYSWGQNASAGFVTNPIPAATGGGNASQSLGFPPITSDPLGSGGIPPTIWDFNGILSYLSLWAQWMQAGAPVRYDGTFQTNISGYPNGAIVQSGTTVGKLWMSTADNNTSDPDTGGANWTNFLTISAGAVATGVGFTVNGNETVTGNMAVDGNLTVDGLITNSNSEAINIGGGGQLNPASATLTADNADGIAGQFRTGQSVPSFAITCRVDLDTNAFTGFYFGTNEVGSISTNAVSTSYNTTSDERIKFNITAAPYDPTWITKVTVRQYEFIAQPGKPQIGAIAQELAVVAPEAVTAGDDNPDLKPGDDGFKLWGVDRGALVWRMIQELQAQRGLIEAMQVRMAELEGTPR